MKQKTKSLSCINVSPKYKKPAACIIWLHGLGADGNDFLSMIDELKIPNKEAIKFILPTAPKKHITVNQGMLMNAWYDIKSMDFPKDEDEEGIKSSYLLIKELIDLEINKGIPSNKIILGGFSQGGAMSVYTGLQIKSKLAGIISLSAYTVLENKLKNQVFSINKNTPFFLGHGLFDPLVPLYLGERQKNLLSRFGCDVTFYTYPTQHTVSAQEIIDISQFIANVL